MGYSDVPNLPDLNDYALSPRFAEFFVPMEEQVFAFQTLLQNNMVGYCLIAERIAQVAATQLGTDEDLGTNSPSFEEWTFNSVP